MKPVAVIHIEHDLADVEKFANTNLDDLRTEELRFIRYGHRFVASRNYWDLSQTLSVDEVHAAVSQAGDLTKHQLRVWVACKSLAGQGLNFVDGTRVFSSYEAMERYFDAYHADDPSPNEDDVLINSVCCIVDLETQHDPCNCAEQIGQQDALEELEPAAPGPQSGGKVDARASRVRASGNKLTVYLVDGRSLCVPRNWFGFLQTSNDAQWQGVMLDGTKQFLKWPRFRKRVAIAALLGVP